MPFAITSPWLCCGLGNGGCEGIKHARRVGEELDFIWLGKGSKIKLFIFAEFSAKGYPPRAAKRGVAR